MNMSALWLSSPFRDGGLETTKTTKKREGIGGIAIRPSSQPPEKQVSKGRLHSYGAPMCNRQWALMASIGFLWEYLLRSHPSLSLRLLSSGVSRCTRERRGPMNTRIADTEIIAPKRVQIFIELSNRGGNEPEWEEIIPSICFYDFLGSTRAEGGSHDGANPRNLTPRFPHWVSHSRRHPLSSMA